MKLAIGLLAAVFAYGAEKPILPDQFGKFKLLDRAPAPAVEPVGVTAEYGLEAAETAHYTGPQKLAVTVWRFKDSTGALAFHQWQQTQPGDWRQAGSYIIRFEDPKTRTAVARALVAVLPPAGNQPLPLLPKYLPGKGLVAGSLRYVLGDASLKHFESQIPSQIARFDMGAEAQLAKYRTAVGELSLAIFSYPTPQIARLQIKELEKVPGAVAHRSGPLVSVAFGPYDEAINLAASVEYQASIILNEPTKDYSGNPGDMLIAIFQMIGYILLFCIGAGLLVAGIRRLQDHGFGTSRALESMIRLHLEDK